MYAHGVTLAALSALSLVSAQSDSNSTFTIDPEKVDIADRVAWCNAQQNSCTTLCGAVESNDCSVDDLNFKCTCANGNSPDMNEYMNTMPWFVCEKLQDNCITANENDAAGQKNCTSTYQDHCGTEKVTDHQGEAGASDDSSSTSSSTATPTGGSDGASSTAATSSTATPGAAVPTAHLNLLGNGVAVAAAGLFAYAL
ncbi:hypothetical protein F4780DRAFT_761042 [Xylariomycetidae sp. FL0641]|nr:hypothetical protein F4780DRAFT_761042 [Xylariomycetidae sp. FL0641]